MNNTIAYYPLHYGKQYFRESLKSVYPFVDAIVVLYTSEPSYGHGSTMKNPETEEELRLITDEFKDRLEWRTISATNEGAHRGIIEEIAQEKAAELILAVDSDEIWREDDLRQALSYAADLPNRTYRVPFIHFWRDHSRVCLDQAQPHRITKVLGDASYGDAYVPNMSGVHHFGYAISNELMHYKWDIHGHKNELRPEWMEEIWIGKNDDHPDGVHPTCRDRFWVPQPFTEYR